MDRGCCVEMMPDFTGGPHLASDLRRDVFSSAQWKNDPSSEIQGSLVQDLLCDSQERR